MLIHAETRARGFQTTQTGVKGAGNLPASRETHQREMLVQHRDRQARLIAESHTQVQSRKYQTAHQRVELVEHRDQQPQLVGRPLQMDEHVAADEGQAVVSGMKGRQSRPDHGWQPQDTRVLLDMHIWSLSTQLTA